MADIHLSLSGRVGLSKKRNPAVSLRMLQIDVSWVLITRQNQTSLADNHLSLSGRVCLSKKMNPAVTLRMLQKDMRRVSNVEPE